MDTQTALRQTVAEFFQIAPDQVSGDLNFHTRMGGSVARGHLDAAIQRRLKIVCPQVHTARTYAELEAAILGKPFMATALGDPAASLRSPQPVASATATVGAGLAMENIACGIDIESPQQFPVEADYWESDFYRINFSRAEIAYCMAQADPPQHFAARWCAKEALKKCDVQYLSSEMNRLEVVLDGSGRPALHLRSAEGDSTRLPVAVSLTHLGTLAAAVVVKADAAKPAATASPNMSEAETVPETPLEGTPVVRRRNWWQRFFG